MGYILTKTPFSFINVGELESINKRAARQEMQALNC